MYGIKSLLDDANFYRRHPLGNYVTDPTTEYIEESGITYAPQTHRQPDTISAGYGFPPYLTPVTIIPVPNCHSPFTVDKRDANLSSYGHVTNPIINRTGNDANSQCRGGTQVGNTNRYDSIAYCAQQPQAMANGGFIDHDQHTRPDPASNGYPLYSIQIPNEGIISTSDHRNFGSSASPMSNPHPQHPQALTVGWSNRRGSRGDQKLPVGYGERNNFGLYECFDTCRTERWGENGFSRRYNMLKHIESMGCGREGTLKRGGVGSRQ